MPIGWVVLDIFASVPSECIGGGNASPCVWAISRPMAGSLGH